MKAFFRVSRIMVMIVALSFTCPAICVKGTALAEASSGGATISVISYYAPGSNSYSVNFSDVTTTTWALSDDGTISTAHLSGNANGLSFLLTFPLPDYSQKNFNLPITYSTKDVDNKNISLLCNWLLRVDEENLEVMLGANTKDYDFTVTITSIDIFPQGMSSIHTYVTGTFDLRFDIDNDISITVLGSFSTSFFHCRGSWLSEQDYAKYIDEYYDEDYDLD